MKLAGGDGRRLTVIVPFDRIESIDGGLEWRRVSPRIAAWATSRALVAESLAAAVADAPYGALDAPAWQLLTSQLLVEGHAARVLLADAVGLGKTIQAGFAIVTLRRIADPLHVLVLVPAGLRDQWVAELSMRFSMQPWVADLDAWRRARRELPPGVSPWRRHQLVLASIDYFKQPEVLASAVDVPWDLLVVDEAHHLAPGSDRLGAAQIVASSARRVLLLTATPHSGDDRAFRALCDLGGRGPGDPPIVMVRRTRSEIGLAVRRRARLVRVSSSDAERRLHLELARYARQVWDGGADGAADARLAMAVLLKRAASSPAALERSLEHRCRSLAVDSAPAETQAALPFDDERDESDATQPAVLGTPGLSDRAREVRVLHELASLARMASQDWHKAYAIVRRLRAMREPAVVFTEYRDTLVPLSGILKPVGPVAVLHGGLSRVERRASLDAFATGRARILLATDVAGEGLNLHAVSRCVLSVEVPWTPPRLEQRIGRVDRIGQDRRVHALTFTGDSEHERAVLVRLGARLRRAHDALPTSRREGIDDLTVAAAALGLSMPTPSGLASDHEPAPVMLPPPVVHPRGLALELRAAGLVARAVRSGDERLPAAATQGIRWTRLRPRDGAEPLPPGVIFVFRVSAASARRSDIAEAVVAVHVSAPRNILARGPCATVLRALSRRAAPCALQSAVELLAARVVSFRRRTKLDLSRERLRVAEESAGQRALTQPGLFDRRAVTEAAMRRVRGAGAEAASRARVAELEADLVMAEANVAEPLAAFVTW